MKKVLVTLYLFMFLGIISAQSIELNYPSEVDVNSEFEVGLKLVDFEDGTYDVKIDITKDGARVSRILVDGTFKSTFYYVKEAVADEAKFSLKIVEKVEGEVDIVVRVRWSGGSSSELFGGYVIKVASGETTDDVNDESEEKIEEDEKDKPSDNPADIETPDIKKDEGEINSPIKIEFEQSKSIKSESSTNFNKNLLGLSGIFAISIFLGMVYIKKQGKYKNEFR